LCQKHKISAPEEEEEQDKPTPSTSAENVWPLNAIFRNI
jgi:hypothetical protein